MPKISPATVKNAAVAVAATSCSAAQAIQAAVCGNSPGTDLAMGLGDSPCWATCCPDILATSGSNDFRTGWRIP